MPVESLTRNELARLTRTTGLIELVVVTTKSFYLYVTVIAQLNNLAIRYNCEFLGSIERFSQSIHPLGLPGTVTASPSPLGLSLTPPPTLGGSLGVLVGGASRVSAAPGAEAKFRASAVPALTANGVFGSSSSLFPNLVGKPGRGGAAGVGDKSAGGRSRLLEDFRNNRFVFLHLFANGISLFTHDLLIVPENKPTADVDSPLNYNFSFISFVINSIQISESPIARSGSSYSRV